MTKNASNEDDAVSRAIELLVSEARRRLERRGLELSSLDGDERVQLSLALPFDAASATRAAASLDESLNGALAELAARSNRWQSGHVFCYRCGRSACPHSESPEARSVFVGYGPSGVPRFVELGQALLERGVERVEELYRHGGALITALFTEDDLHRDLLPAFRESGREQGAPRLHGQVVAGYWGVEAREASGDVSVGSRARLGRGSTGRLDGLAVTFQVLSSGGSRPRLGLNLVGQAPDDLELELVVNRFGESPWREPVLWARRALADIERSLRDDAKGAGPKSGGPSNKSDNAHEGDNAKKGGKAAGRWHKRIVGVVEGLERRLRRLQRVERRRTQHAEERGRQRRPVDKALADLRSARAEEVLVDRRRDTLIVLGERGRVHVFNPAGKLVTSLHFEADSIARRLRNGRWRPAPREQLTRLKDRASA